MARLTAGDAPMMTKLDPLRHDAMDVHPIVKRLAGEGLRIRCLAL
ncbi:hypothetical protein RM533_00030 [Croceicoccus sp. F390]|uniref:Resolvase/invertase-type recombinase catalytic domain-containing protein n=1 Tax=Croceicoccus esteveae TaxID=3075597 RepID=A0ABU2ZEC7_9SPHN|nr:hypothetical protein [Croceicoccus sp. F390]MDT0574566.1 hypothetical protein [Croceicoccus sp. F390]